MKNILYNEIFENLNIKKSDVIFISSDIYRLARIFAKKKIKLDANILIDILIEKITPTGTLIFPTYNWDFFSGITFDYHNTISQMGVLTNVALKRKDFERTKHPLCSFAVYGNDKKYLCSLKNKSSFGMDSPFNYFYENSAKNLFIDIDYQNSATFVHHLEEKLNVKYRYTKNITGDYIDEHNNRSKKTYSQYVHRREMNSVITVNPMHEIFLKNQCVEDEYYNKIILLRILDMKKAYDLVELDILYNDSKNLVSFISKK